MFSELLRTRLALGAGVLFFAAPSLLPAQGTLPPPSVDLTAAQIEQLLTVIPKIQSRTTAGKSHLMGQFGGGGAPAMDEAELGEIQKLLAGNGLTLEQFAMRVMVVFATYLTLQPGALDSHLDVASRPEVKKALADPNVPQREKDRIQRQMAFSKKNLPALRQQFEVMATPHNKRVVRPFLSRIQKVMAAAR